MRSLYISHNGMLEGLGRTQVVPYLRGLARRGVEIELLSYELEGADARALEGLRASFSRWGVRWVPLTRRRDTRLLVKVQESAHGATRALMSALARRPHIVHGRSYLPTAVADVVASLLPRARLLFDCRGLLGDENVDAGHWTTDRLEYRLVKRYEARAFRRADGVVVLTHALERWARERQWFGTSTHVEVIPCCVDLDEFVFDGAARQRVRGELRLGDCLVVAYAGSLGSWYRESEIAGFAAAVRRRSARPVRFLLLTPSSPTELVGMLTDRGFDGSDVVVRRVSPEQMPAYLSAADIGISFIKSCFSKKASSPTKVGEYLACGLPVVLNGDVGDQAELAVETKSCVVLRKLDDSDIDVAAQRMIALAEQPLPQRVARCRATALAHYDLERVGVDRYERLYRQLAR